MTAGGGRPRKPVSHGDDIERDGSAKGLVAVEIIVALRAAEDLREHVAKQQRVLDADVHSLPAGRAVYVCGIPGEEYGTTPIRVGNPVVDPESELQTTSWIVAGWWMGPRSLRSACT